MRHILPIAVLAVVGAGCESGMRMPGQQQAWHEVTLADQIKWESNPAGLPPGAKIAVLEGDPAKRGFFTMRLWAPDGYRIMPHWHPNAERATVLSGMVYLGVGDRFDQSAARALPAGSYTSMSPRMHHFAWTKGETVIQLSSMGPWGITYVNPADDPRKAGKK